MSQTVVVSEPLPLPFESANAVLMEAAMEIATAATNQATTAANQLVKASAPHWDWFDSGGSVEVVLGEPEEGDGELSIPIDWAGAKRGRLLTGLSGALRLARSNDTSSQLTFVGSHQHPPGVDDSDELLGDQAMKAIARSFLASAAVDLVARTVESAS